MFLQLLLSEAQRVSRKKGKDEVRELRRELEAERREKERETREKEKERARHLGLLQGLAMAQPLKRRSDDDCDLGCTVCVLSIRTVQPLVFE